MSTSTSTSSHSSSSDLGRILSIQSHVTFGYVGGKAATFPLQCLGYDVDIVNTVNFSNHSGYGPGRSGGSKTSSTDLESIFSILELNELLRPGRVLTGYTPNAQALSVIVNLIKKLKARDSSIIYLCDPVIGDAGLLYVSPDVIPIYKELLPLADIITPNWFEMETLTDIQLLNIPSLKSALQKLHKQYHVPRVVVSSIPLKPWLFEALPEHIKPQKEGEYLLCIASEKQSGEGESVVHATCVDVIPGYFSGVGDLFSALCLGHYHCHPTSSVSSTSASSPSQNAYSSASATTEETPLSHAVSLSLLKTHSLLTLTHSYTLALPPEEREPTDDEKDDEVMERRTRRMRGRELRVVQGVGVLMKKEMREFDEGEGTKMRMKRWDGFWE